jgi:hypothetical protein
MAHATYDYLCWKESCDDRATRRCGGWLFSWQAPLRPTEERRLGSQLINGHDPASKAKDKCDSTMMHLKNHHEAQDDKSSSSSVPTKATPGRRSSCFSEGREGGVCVH